jgi:hypothetical protein
MLGGVWYHCHCSFFSSEWEQQNNISTLEVAKRDLLELPIQLIEVSKLIQSLF